MSWRLLPVVIKKINRIRKNLKKQQRRLCGWVPEEIDNFDMPTICGERNVGENISQSRHKNTPHMIKILFVVLLLSFGVIILFQRTRQVVYFGTVNKISTSGESRFQRVDKRSLKVVDPNDQYAWFWAMPPIVSDNEKVTDDWVRFIMDNENAVFKITGTRGQEDCGYYGPDHCIENIDVKKIEVVGTNKIMEF